MGTCLVISSLNCLVDAGDMVQTSGTAAAPEFSGDAPTAEPHQEAQALSGTAVDSPVKITIGVLSMPSDSLVRFWQLLLRNAHIHFGQTCLRGNGRWFAVAGLPVI